jgi:hypothetical protein
MTRVRASWIAGASLGLVAGCFKSDFLSGLPCTDDSECGDLKCEQNFCGGPQGVTSPGTTTDDPSTTDASADDDPTTSGPGPTTDPETSLTTVDPDSTTESDSSSSDDGTTCPPDCPCEPPPHDPCDGDGNSLVLALGLACPGEADAESSQFGSVAGRTTRDVIGGFTAREGERFAVLGSGLASELTMETPDGDPSNMPTYCSDDQGGSFDVGTLPEPLTSVPASGSCDDPEIVAEMADCSGSLEDEIVSGINDYSSLTIEVTVPEDMRSFSFDFAFSSIEYPSFVGMTYNDLFVAWLVSEAWTGNISYDGADAISVNSDLLVVTDEDADEPMFTGTCLRGHASTGWLTTTAPATAGDPITLIFAVFDQGDSSFDSFAFIDAFRWSCSPVPEPETHS